MFSVSVTLLMVAPWGMFPATSKAKSALLADPPPVFPAKRCWPEPLLVKLLEAWYKVLSLLAPKDMDCLPPSSCGSSVGGATVGLGSRVAIVSWVGAGAGVSVGVVVGVETVVAVGAGESVGIVVGVGTVVAIGAGVGVGSRAGVGANVAAGSAVAVAAGVAAGAEVAEAPQADASNTEIAASPAINLVLFLCPIRQRFI